MTPSCFLSSTFAHSKFERRYVARAIVAAGFDVVLAEHRSVDPDDAIRDCNRLLESCEYAVVLLGDSSGSVADDFLVMELPYIYCEARAASSLGLPVLVYRLRPPFPDDELLLDRGENINELHGCRRARGERFHWAMNLDYQLAPHAKREISSVSELGRCIPEDLRNAERFRASGRLERSKMLATSDDVTRKFLAEVDFRFCDCGTLIGSRPIFGSRGACHVCGVDVEARREGVRQAHR
jgi:hypothetical protein